MQAVSYIDNSNDRYVIEPIVTTDTVDADATDALLLVENSVPYEDYRRALEDSVKQGLAFSIYKNNERVGYVYNRMVEYTYNGACINIQDTGAMILALKTMFEINDSPRIYLDPTEHNLSRFISMLNGKSIRVWHNTGKSAYVSKAEIVIRGEKAYNYFGFREV